ncbi:MAG: nascent polypeptide-associated complex protein [Candidatus Nanohaloarchaea archaeon]|nr:nascent polypeptide-associated complex protein [Candidatus Nanohaloarchaea archaeon]
MFNPKNMMQAMKKMGMDMEEMGAEKIVVDLGDEEMVFKDPEFSKVSVKGKEMFQLQGDYSRRAKGPSQEDIELVAEKADVSEDEARKALEENSDITDAIMSLK